MICTRWKSGTALYWGHWELASSMGAGLGTDIGTVGGASTVVFMRSSFFLLQGKGSGKQPQSMATHSCRVGHFPQP